jgi:hypothetical protein
MALREPFGDILGQNPGLTPKSSRPGAQLGAHIGRSLVMALALTTLFGCGSERKKLQTGKSTGQVENSVNAIASEKQISPRILLVAAHTQSSFGAPSDPGLMRQTARSLYYAMPVASTGPIDGNDIAANTKLLAGKMSEIAKASPPQKPFDWLVIAANVIAGQVADDPNVRDLEIRSVLVELINTYNRGFSAVAAGDTVALAPLPEQQRIVTTDLDERQIQYINGFRFRKDYGSDFFLAGPTQPTTAEKDKSATPRLLIIWCPASNLVCLDSYRTNKDSPVHFLVTRSLDGQLETTQYYPILQDLSWYGSILKNTTIIAISGQAGRTPANFQPDWIDFEGYASLRTIIRNVFDQTLRKFFGAADADKLLADPALFRNNVVELKPALKAGLGVTFPDGALDTNLPVFWDSGIFWELLTDSRPVRIREQILISSPTTGMEFDSADVPFSILLTDDVRSIELFQDSAVTDARPDPWELVLKREVDPATRRRETFTHPFTRRGALTSNHRAIKLVARDSTGTVLASKIVRFQVRTIK